MSGADEFLAIWTITHRPSDLPGVEYAVRPHYLTRGGGARVGPDVLTANTLEEARALLPPFLHCLGRSRDDDPVIVESWI